MKVLFRVLLFTLIFALMLIGRTAFDIHSNQYNYIIPKFEMHDFLAVQRFSKGLQIKTISNPIYKETDFNEFEKFISYLKNTYPAVFEKCKFTRVNKYNLVFKLEGEDKNILPNLLSAHYDVVGVKNERNWLYPPFSGYFDEKYIYSRGTLDDKASVFAIMEALNSVLKEDFKPKGDLYIAFSHCEETGSSEGAIKIIEYFRKNNIHFNLALDEGGRIVNKNGKIFAFIGTSEKGRLLSKITLKGEGSHASTPHLNSPVFKLAKLIKIFSENNKDAYLSDEMLNYYLKTYSSYPLSIKFLISNRLFLSPLLYQRLSQDPEDNARIHSTNAITVLEASNVQNAISSDASMIVDTRILPDFAPIQMKEKIKKLVYSNFDENEVEIEFISEMNPSLSNGVGTENYKKLSSQIEKIYNGMIIVPYLTLGATDARDYAEISNDAYRFLPAVLTPYEAGLMHSDNEKISIENWGRMIKFYREFIKNN